MLKSAKGLETTFTFMQRLRWGRDWLILRLCKGFGWVKIGRGFGGEIIDGHGGWVTGGEGTSGTSGSEDVLDISTEVLGAKARKVVGGCQSETRNQMGVR